MTRAPADRPATIIISNAVPLNGGDAAILQALVQGIRRRVGADTRIVALSSQAVVSARYHADLGVEFRESLSRVVELAGRKPVLKRGRGLERFLLRTLSTRRFAAGFALRARGFDAADRLLTDEERALVALYDDADYVVATGGTYLVENYSIDSRVREFQVAMRLGVPLALGTQSMGPFRRASARMLRPVFEYADLLLLRDEASHAHVRSTGARANAAVVGDVAFTLGNASDVTAARTRALPTDRPLRVGANVRDWPFFKTKSRAAGMRGVVESFAALSEHLARRHKARVEFVSTCQGIPEYWKDDSRVAQKVLESANRDGIAREALGVDGSFRTPDALLEHYKRFDLIVSMRMHGAILALSAGVPVLPVAYEPKTKDLFDRLGFGDWVLDVESLSPESLITTCDRVLTELPARRAALFDAVLAEMRSAEHGLDLLAEAIRAARAPGAPA